MSLPFDACMDSLLNVTVHPSLQSWPTEMSDALWSSLYKCVVMAVGDKPGKFRCPFEVDVMTS